MATQEHAPLASDQGKLSPLASVSQTRGTLEAFGLSTKYSLGQNFLINDDILKKIVALADLGPQDNVLEVGPGIGTLTIALLKSAGFVTSIEYDSDLPQVLAQTCKPWIDRFALVQKDALDVREEDLEGLPVANKLVANLPYAVAATVVLDYFQRFDHIQGMTVMVQKEVADRMAASPGSKNYGAYTVKLGFYAQPVGRFSVSPGNFFPPPRVESSVIRLDKRVMCDTAGNPAGPELLAAACLMADASFATRRKTIANSCKTFFGGRGPEGKRIIAALPQIFEEAGIDPRCRGEVLDRERFIAMGEAYLRIAK